MIIDGHFPAILQTVSVNQPQKLLIRYFGLAMIFALQNFVGRKTKLEVRYWTETDSFAQSSIPNKLDTSNGNKGTPFPHVHAPHTHKTHTFPDFHASNVFHMLKHFVANQTLFRQHNIQTFLLLTPMVSICTPANQIVTL